MNELLERKTKAIFYIKFSFDLIYFPIFQHYFITFEQKKINVWAGSAVAIFNSDERIERVVGKLSMLSKLMGNRGCKLVGRLRHSSSA